MRTNIELDEGLIQEAFKHANVSTKKDLVHLALKEFVENHSRRDISELRGKVRFHEEYDYKRMRQET